VLNDKQKREIYDLYGEEGLKGGPPPSSSEGEVFQAVFQVVAEHSHSPQVTNYIYINVVITTYIIIDTHLFSLINIV